MPDSEFDALKDNFEFWGARGKLLWHQKIAICHYSCLQKGKTHPLIGKVKSLVNVTTEMRRRMHVDNTASVPKNSIEEIWHGNVNAISTITGIEIYMEKNKDGLKELHSALSNTAQSLKDCKSGDNSTNVFRTIATQVVAEIIICYSTLTLLNHFEYQ